MQDKIVLGFLIDGSKTGYQIKQLMEKSTKFFFNTSLGSIYPAFGKLEKNGMVKKEQKIENGRLKNQYSITSKGKKHFYEWLNKTISVPKVRNEALLKIFFFSNLSEDLRAAQVEIYLNELKKSLEDLKNLQEKLKSLNIDPFQMSTLKFGIDYYSFVYDWFNDFLTSLDNKGGKK